MQISNLNERTKRTLKYSALTAASLVLLYIIFQRFPGNASTTAIKPETPARSILRQYKEALETNILLHQQLQAIEEMDKNYASLMIHSVNALKADSMYRAIKSAEQLFRDKLDSTVQRHANGDWSDSLVKNIDIFKTELDNRQGGTGQSDFMESKSAMLDKDIRIADLEAEVRSLKSAREAEINTLPAGSDQKEDNSRLKRDFDELQKNYNSLAETNSRLHKTNDILSSQLKASDPADKENIKSAEKQTSSLERKINDLNAELYFSTVDCNLSRVDVNQIISNSKQRRALLRQAMDILTYLKSSTNPEIQQRAEEKIERLTKIISTVRD